LSIQALVIPHQTILKDNDQSSPFNVLPKY